MATQACLLPRTSLITFAFETEYHCVTSLEYNLLQPPKGKPPQPSASNNLQAKWVGYDWQDADISLWLEAYLRVRGHD